MTGLLPAAVYGLEVPCGDVLIPAVPNFPASFRITMAALDPSAEPEFSGSAIDGSVPRATLKLIRENIADDDDYDEEDEEKLRAILNADDDMDDDDDDEEDDSEDEDAMGGPSDPSKSKKARKEAAIESLKEALAAADEDEDMPMDGINGAKAKKSKGKEIANGLVDDDEDDDEEEDEDDMEEYVICTLDTTQHYQTPLDITIGEDEQVYFKVSGTHNVYLTGNYVIPVDDTPGRQMYDDEEDEDYDMSPDEDELDDEESDELDDMDDPRITELDSDEEEAEAPKLVAKGKNKRPASDSEEEGVTLDDIMAKSLKPAEAATNGDVKLSKKQKKKLKHNAGDPVKAESDTSGGKKVQFAKNLEQGPSGTGVTNGKGEQKAKAEKNGKNEKVSEEKPKSGGAVGVHTVKGVKLDVKKVGSGPAAKKGNKVSMRYIGKLKDGKQFDANKKGRPFTFKLGAGEVIQGWDIGVEGICAGGERRLTIPAHLAYGKKSLPGIPPNSELIFDIKCLEIS